MEPLSKRQRISEPLQHPQLHGYDHNRYIYEEQTADAADEISTSGIDDDDEETTYDSEIEDDGVDTFNDVEEGDIYSANEDVEDENAGLAHLRAQASQKLKSRFESIFEKYGKDFSGVGDEIDLETGEIVVNNGHLVDMQDETDAGQLGEGKGILRALTVEPADQYVETDDADDDKRSYPKRANTVMQVVDSEEDDEDDDGLLVDDSEASFVAGDTGIEVEQPDKSIGSIKKKSYPTNAEILEQFGPELGPEIIKVVARQRHTGEDCIELAWRVPNSVRPLPRKGPKILSLPPLESTEERSPSPVGNRSIWAPQVGPGRPRKDAAFPHRQNNKSRINRPSGPRYKPRGKISMTREGLTPRRGPGRPPKRHSDHSRSTTRLGSPILDTFEDGIGQILGESSKNLQPSLISNSRSFRPRGPARRDPESISWAEAVAAVEEIDPHLYAGLVEDAKAGKRRRARAYSMDSLSTSSFDDESSPPRKRYTDENAVHHPSLQPRRERIEKRSKLTAKNCKLTSGQLARNSVLEALLSGVEEPEQMIQYVGTTIEGIQHQVAAIPCPHIDCASLSTTLYRCQCIGNENSSQITNHLRDVHDTTPYPCEEPGCHRRGGKGYFRSRDLAKHVITDHPGIAAYDRLRPRIAEATFDVYDCYEAERASPNSLRSTRCIQENRPLSTPAEQSQSQTNVDLNRPISGTPDSNKNNLKSRKVAPVNNYGDDNEDPEIFDHDPLGLPVADAVTVSPKSTTTGRMGLRTSKSSIKTRSPRDAVMKTPKRTQFLIPASDDDSSVILSSAPLSQDQPSGTPSKTKPTEKVSRNKIDPAYEFSDEEEYSHPHEVAQSQRPELVSRSADISKQAKSEAANKKPDSTSRTDMSNSKSDPTEYKYPCLYRDSHDCKRIFREPKIATRHSKSHVEKTVFNCDSPGCARWFSSYSGMCRHMKDEHLERGKDISERPEYLLKTDGNGSNDDAFDDAQKDDAQEDLPPPYSSVLTLDKLPKVQKSLDVPSPAARQEYLQLCEEPFTIEIPMIPKSLGKQKSQGSDSPSAVQLYQLTEGITKERHSSVSTTKEFSDKTTSVISTESSVTDCTSKSEVAGKVSSQVKNDEPPGKGLDSTGSDAMPLVSSAESSPYIKSPPPIIAAPTTKSNTKFSPQMIEQRSPSSLPVQTARSDFQSSRAMMPPPQPPAPTPQANQSKNRPYMTSTPLPKFEKSMRPQTKGALKPVSLPSMNSIPAHSTPAKEIHRSVEQTEGDDLDELDLAFDSPALMKIRANSVALSLAAKKLPTPLGLSNGMRIERSVSADKKSFNISAGNESTPSKPSKQTSRLSSSHSSPSDRTRGPDKTRETPVRLCDMSSGEKASRNPLVTPVKRKRSMLVMDDTKSGDEGLVKTPGGSLRRCGEDGFKCDRDFCFTCL